MSLSPPPQPVMDFASVPGLCERFGLTFPKLNA
jgi:hypothetical protein